MGSLVSGSSLPELDVPLEIDTLLTLWLRKELQPGKRQLVLLVPWASTHGHLGCPEFDQQFKMDLQKENVSSLQKGLSPGKSFCDAGGCSAMNTPAMGQ